MWNIDIGEDLKRQLFVATVESVLLCGAETCTLTAQQERALDGVYNATNGTKCHMDGSLSEMWSSTVFRDLLQVTDKSEREG